MENAQKEPSILLVDDQEIDLSVLNAIFSPKYSTVLKRNGKEAIDYLKSKDGGADLVITDLVMPKLNGYGLLKAMREDETLKDIPVFVITQKDELEEEKKLLKMGAWDFINKPYDQSILLIKAKNALAKSQIGAGKELKFLTKYDSLTGIYNKNRFISETKFMLDQNPDIDFDLVRLDIRSFRIINSVFGLKAGDETLKNIARKLSEFFDPHPNTTYARIQSDLFAFCAPARKKEDYASETAMLQKFLLDFPSPLHLSMTFGVYNIRDRSVDVSVMIDDANAAAREARKEGKPFGVFTHDMENVIQEEEAITAHMTSALENKEFQVYFQPKYDLKADKVAGAEALVRWFSPTLGNISPARFIPIFEKNGFVSALDEFVWEEACKFLASTMKDGHEPLPISINVSKVDVYSIDIVDRLTSLVEKYGIEPRYLCIEITESVFIDDIDTFNDIVSRLRSKGFLIFMDDFGSGYSSLNVLKDMDVDVLKIDMRFFSYTKNNKKSNSIVENVIRLAHSIGMTVIAEGVEKQDQADFLRLVNCDYIQGYVFSKAICEDDYRTMISGPNHYKALSSFNTSLIWDDDTRGIFDTSLQPFCLVKTSPKDDIIDYVYTNVAYDKMFGHVSTASREKVRAGILPDYRKVVVNAFKKCHDTKGSNQCECLAIMPDGKIKWISMFSRLVYEKEDIDVVLCSFTDITALKSLQSELDSKMLEKVPLHLSTLLISESPQILTEVSNMLVGNFEVIYTAKNSKEAIEKIEMAKDDLDLVFVDLSMPKDDFDALKGIFAYDKAHSYRVLALITSEECKDLLVNELDYIDDFIIYPFTKKMLMLRLRNTLNIAFSDAEIN